MRTTGPVAVAPQGDLDSMAYGQPDDPPPQRSLADSGGGAIARASRSAFAAAPRSYAAIVAAPVAYVEPVPVRYDAAYHLDAGDRLRVVVYGQEGLTNTYAIDAGGSITMPLIGSVPARGRTHGRTGGGDHRPSCAPASSASPRSRWRSKPIGRSSSSARSPHPGNIRTCPT